jgi:hypothetical protein
MPLTIEQSKARDGNTQSAGHARASNTFCQSNLFAQGSLNISAYQKGNVSLFGWIWKGILKLGFDAYKLVHREAILLFVMK